MGVILYHTITSWHHPRVLLTLSPMFLDKHTHVEFWSWTQQRRENQTGERRQLEWLEYLLKCARAQTAFWVCRPKNTQTHRLYVISSIIFDINNFMKLARDRDVIML